jgi:predicted Fe-Mo cluster-binding NifX family protein
LAAQGVNLVIAGGMGMKAMAHFQASGIEVLQGVTEGVAEELVDAYLKGELVAGANPCDHDGQQGCKGKGGRHGMGMGGRSS